MPRNRSKTSSNGSQRSWATTTTEESFWHLWAAGRHRTWILWLSRARRMMRGSGGRRCWLSRCPQRWKTCSWSRFASNLFYGMWGSTLWFPIRIGRIRWWSNHLYGSALFTRLVRSRLAMGLRAIVACIVLQTMVPHSIPHSKSPISSQMPPARLPKIRPKTVNERIRIPIWILLVIVERPFATPCFINTD